MTPVVLRPLPDEQNLEKHLEKQMGCVAGLFHIFDRHQLISGKRVYWSKRIPSFSSTGSTSPSERSDFFAIETSDMFPSSPENLPQTPENYTIPLPVFDFKEGSKNSWKLREAPRLSLDSRLRPREIRTKPAIQSSSDLSDASDADSDKNRRSPSVVARLMGLDALPDDRNGGHSMNKAELRRSASESRVSRDLQRFVEGSFFQKPLPPPDFAAAEIHKLRSTNFPLGSKSKQMPPPSKQSPSVALQRRSYFNAQDFFPEPNRAGSRSLFGEIEKRLRMRGIDEPAKDLETLKQILEALQLKGLLHSNIKPSNQQVEYRRNLISDRPIVIMKPGPRPVRISESEPQRSASVRRNPVEERRCRDQSSRLPDPNPRRRPLGSEPRARMSPGYSSPKSSPRKMAPDTFNSRSPRNRRLIKERLCSTAEDDTATTISESSVSSSSLYDLERSRIENRAGRSLLERCHKLLNSIAAFTSAEQAAASDPQPSPVSVLDSSYLAEESSPSPVLKRSIEFKGWEDEDGWLPASPTIGSRPDYVPECEYPDFAYVSNVLTASDRHPNTSSHAYRFLEKRHGATASATESKLHRRLIFDTVEEILDRKRQVSPWVSFMRRGPAAEGAQLIREVWTEVRRVGEKVEAEDLNGVTSGAIRKAMAGGDHAWGDTSAEMSDAVLQIERLVFKDLVVEMIRDLADLAGSNNTHNPLPRRRLLF